MDKTTKIVIAVAAIFAMRKQRKKKQLEAQLSTLMEETFAYLDGIQQITFDERFKDIVDNYDK